MYDGYKSAVCIHPPVQQILQLVSTKTFQMKSIISIHRSNMYITLSFYQTLLTEIYPL